MITRDEMEPREVVIAFARAMEERLRANDHKGGWSQCSPGYLRRRLRTETRELFDVLDEMTTLRREGRPYAHLMAKVTHEAADLANFALMLADNCGDLDPLPAATGRTP